MNCWHGIQLPVMQYAWKTCSLTLKGKRRLWLFQNSTLGRIFGPKSDGYLEWGSLQNEDIHSVFLSPNIHRVIKSRRLKWPIHVAKMEWIRSKPIEKRYLGRPKRRWQDNIRMNLKKIIIKRGIGLIWLRIEIIGEPLWMRHWSSGFHKPRS